MTVFVTEVDRGLWDDLEAKMFVSERLQELLARPHSMEGQPTEIMKTEAAFMWQLMNLAWDAVEDGLMIFATSTFNALTSLTEQKHAQAHLDVDPRWMKPKIWERWNMYHEASQGEIQADGQYAVCSTCPGTVLTRLKR